jgi:flagellar motor protein MotB
MTAANDTAEEGGEGYFASVSDLMVGILFIFLLMLTVFALNFRDDEDKQKVALAELLAAQAEAEKARRAADTQRVKNEELRRLLQRAVARMTEELEGRQAARKRLLSTLEQRLRDDGLTVIIDPDSGILRLPDQLLFEKGQSELGAVTGRGVVPAKLAEAQGNLAKLARALGEVLPCFSRGDHAVGCGEQDRSTLEGVLIEGHSDRQGYRIGGRALSADESRDLNDRLSVERALTVFKELRQQNSLDELRNSSGFPLLAVSSYGDRRPIASGDTEEEFRLNRRIDLRFLLSSRTSDELQRLVDEIRPALGDRP